MDLAKFVKHFGFRKVFINNSPSSSYFTDREQTTIEMEIDYIRLEHMVDYFGQSEQQKEEEHEEHRLRQQNPALKEAFNKYKMLLELYQ